MLRPLICILIIVTLASVPGCGRVVFRPEQQQAMTITPQQQQLIAQQQQELQQRANQLDLDNQELETLLAQSRQQTQLLSEQISATQGQLKATTDRLAATQKNNQELQNRTQALVASARQPIGASIRPNSTLLQPIQLSNTPGVDVRQDGDVIRVSLSADKLFYTASPQMLPTGQQLVQGVVAELMNHYRDHLIGIEGHTDGAPIANSQYPSAHHLSVAQATSVYDTLQRSGVPPKQMFVIGHGANHPVVSNATEAGRTKNRRMELVVYPETVRQR